MFGEISQKLLIEILDRVYPVGSQYVDHSDGRDPSAILGFGTWTQITDTFIRAAAAGGALGASGGTATQASDVTVATQPTFTVNSHTHTLTAGYAKVYNGSTGVIIREKTGVTAWTNTNISSGTLSSTTASRTSAAELGGTTDATSGTATTRTADVALTNNAVNNLPPYVDAYVWKRVA